MNLGRFSIGGPLITGIRPRYYIKSILSFYIWRARTIRYILPDIVDL